MGVKQNFKKAMEYEYKACDLNFDQGCYALAGLFVYGKYGINKNHYLKCPSIY
jgi:TPR repeat protein